MHLLGYVPTLVQSTQPSIVLNCSLSSSQTYAVNLASEGFMVKVKEFNPFILLLRKAKPKKTKGALEKALEGSSGVSMSPSLFMSCESFLCRGVDKPKSSGTQMVMKSKPIKPSTSLYICFSSREIITKEKGNSPRFLDKQGVRS